MAATRNVGAAARLSVRSGMSPSVSPKPGTSASGTGRHETGRPVVRDNPFTMPSDEEVFTLRDQERRNKLEERNRVKNLQVFEKSTWASKQGRSLAGMERGSDEAQPVRFSAGSQEERTAAMANGIQLSNERRKEKENLADFIAKKREMFLLQMALDTKREEMRKLEERAQKREEALKRSEQMLEEDAMHFDAFLKENDMKAVEAIKRAETETKSKLDKVQEIKKLNAQIMAVKSEMSKYEEQLEECRKCKDFLDSLTPSEYFEERKAEKHRRAQQRKEAAAAAAAAAAAKSKDQAGAEDEDDDEDDDGGKDDEHSRDGNHSASTYPGGNAVPLPANAEEPGEPDAADAETSDDVVDDMYFKEPKQLLDIFAALEESNLFLIQNTQETEEALEELKSKYSETKERMDRESEILQNQIKHLNDAITRERGKATALEQRVTKTTGVEDQEQLLLDLDRKVAEVYVQCGFDNDANLNALQMLRNIEARLEDLFMIIDEMPSEYAENAERQKEKERRHRAREEKLEVQRRQQEERMRRALERSKAPIKKKTGKPVMFRSVPVQKKKKEDVSKAKQNDDEEDTREFFE